MKGDFYLKIHLTLNFEIHIHFSSFSKYKNYMKLCESAFNCEDYNIIEDLKQTIK